MNRYVYFAIIVLVSVVADQATKVWAQNNLASRSSRWEHSVVRTVDTDEAGTTVADWVSAEFGGEFGPTGEVHSVYLRNADGEATTGPLSGAFALSDGDDVEVFHRQITVVPGFWNHIYVQNFGAAWGFLGGVDEKIRRPFFIGISILAVIVVMGLYRQVQPGQRMLATALSLIVGGALGNFIDRVQYGYVVDFIDWYITVGGDEKHWPTFNVADIAITIGVGLLAIEILFGKQPDAQTADASDEEPADAAPA